MLPHGTTVDLSSTANYLALNMLYARRYLAPGEVIDASDVRDFAPGHWGCVPGLNFIWANLVTYAATTSTRTAPLVGTGHGGAAWAAWLLINAADETGRLRRDELDEVIGGFGCDDGTPHELFGAMPDLLWPSGELGYALAVGQGASPELADRVAVILGDGELETGCTLSALAAGPSLPRAPLVIINANGFRMGGSSWFARFPDYGRKLFSSLEWRHAVVREGDVHAFQLALDDDGDSQPKVIVYANQKGGSVPPFPGERSAAGPIHKLPKKELHGEQGRRWLRGWLDSFATRLLSTEGLLSETSGRVAQSSCGLARAVQATGRWRATAVRRRQDGRKSCVEVFIDEVARLEPEALVVSPDEASSNLVHRAGLEIREFLSEQLTFGWAIGAAAAGRTALLVSYEAFAPLVTTMVSQYARHLSRCSADARPRRLPCIVLTSLSFRNVASHQDIGFYADIERRCADSVVFLVPHTLAFAADAARRALGFAMSAETVPIIVVDKYSIGPEESATYTSKNQEVDGWVVYRFGHASGDAPPVAILSLGAVQFHEAVRAARSIIAMGMSSACDVFALWKVGPRDNVTAILADLVGGYNHVAAVAGMDLPSWERILAELHDAGRLIHSAAFKPTAGPNDVVRLFHCDLDWLAIVVSAGMALRANAVVHWARAARTRLLRDLEHVRSAQWYHDLAWQALLERVNLSR